MQMTPDQLTKLLGERGISVDTQRNHIKAQMVWSSVIRGLYKPHLRISDKDVATAVTASCEKWQIDGFEYKMQPLF